MALTAEQRAAVQQHVVGRRIRCPVCRHPRFEALGQIQTPLREPFDLDQQEAIGLQVQTVALAFVALACESCRSVLLLDLAV